MMTSLKMQSSVGVWRMMTLSKRAPDRDGCGQALGTVEPAEDVEDAEGAEGAEDAEDVEGRGQPAHMQRAVKGDDC